MLTVANFFEILFACFAADCVVELASRAWSRRCKKCRDLNDDSKL